VFVLDRHAPVWDGLVAMTLKTANLTAADVTVVHRATIAQEPNPMIGGGGRNAQI
jgi:hypothetical protein